MFGIHLSGTTPHHPAANGLVERFHRSMKAAIMCHADEQWTETLPIVLLGLRTAYKENLKSSTAELVYGEPLRVPGEFLAPVPQQVEVSTFIQQLRQHMNQLRPTPAARHVSPGTFIHRDLPQSSHVFLRQDGARRSLQQPYSGPQPVIARTDKTLDIVVRGRNVTVSVDRVKPAYLLQDDLLDNNSPPVQPKDPPLPSTAPSLEHCKTTRSGRTVRFRAFSYLIPYSTGG